MRVMSREIRDDQQMMLLLSKKTADERIATFLVNLSARFRARGYSANQFRLSMSRNEIGNYLGLAVETVSRVFTRFQQNELIAAEEGVFNCTAVGYCTEVCPKHVDPANAVNLNKTNSAMDYFLRFLSPKGGSK